VIRPGLPLDQTPPADRRNGVALAHTVVSASLGREGAVKITVEAVSVLTQPVIPSVTVTKTRTVPDDTDGSTIPLLLTTKLPSDEENTPPGSDAESVSRPALEQ
jgi:hypothetical protein